MARRVALVPVHVHQPDGSVVVYGVGDEVSVADQKLITNPNVFSAEGESDSPSLAKS